MSSEHLSVMVTGGIYMHVHETLVCLQQLLMHMFAITMGTIKLHDIVNYSLFIIPDSIFIDSKGLLFTLMDFVQQQHSVE